MIRRNAGFGLARQEGIPTITVKSLRSSPLQLVLKFDPIFPQLQPLQAMATKPQDPMENIEKRRLELEENISKLRQALGHWQSWEFEYSILQQEIEAADSPSPSQILEISRMLDSKLVNEKEIQDLLGKENRRSANQVVDMITRRIDYVQQNISTVEKQLDTAEKQLAAASILLEPDLSNEEGLPLMDIVEELDAEGNVVSSEVNQPGKEAPALVEVLRKAGIQVGESKSGQSSQTTEGEKSADTSSTANERYGAAETIVAPAKPESPSVPVPEPSTEKKPRPQKKSVSFADETAQFKKSPLEEHGYNDALSDFNFTKGSKVVEVDEDDKMIATYPIIPQGDTPEEAALRREMLQYGLSEVGSVVAEIDLETPRIEYSDDDDDDDYEEYDSDEEEDEDEYGRSTQKGISNDYRQQMLELEKKLNARMVENVGPQPDLHPLAEYAEDVRTLRIQKDGAGAEHTDAEPSTDAPRKKGVRFADNLDISEAPTGTPQQEPTPPTKTRQPTMSDTIVERTGPAPLPQSSSQAPPTKVSRFKSSRSTPGPDPMRVLPTPPVTPPQPFPRGPAGRTIADTITEHSPSSEPQAPDEFDPVMINREIQVEYHKMRNKMIQQQGGFTPSPEDLESPLVEEENGKTKKVSRFKAAKLKAEGI